MAGSRVAKPSRQYSGHMLLIPYRMNTEFFLPGRMNTSIHHSGCGDIYVGIFCTSIQLQILTLHGLLHFIVSFLVEAAPRWPDDPMISFHPNCALNLIQVQV